MNTPEDEITKELVKELKLIVKEPQNITITSIILYTIELMQFIENYKQLNGCQKKNIIINVIKKITNNTSIMKFINDDLPYLIDILISIEKQELHIKKKKCLDYFKLCKRLILH